MFCFEIFFITIHNQSFLTFFIAITFLSILFLI